LEALGEAAAEPLGLGAQFGVGEAVGVRFEGVDLRHVGQQALYFTFILGAKDLGG
jgi:hypothetical protein